MSITSFPFLALLAVGVLVYYLTPGRAQWVVLLLLSLVFYACSGVEQTIVYLLISTLSAWAAGQVIARKKPWAFGAAMAAIAVNLLLWFFFKGKQLWGGPAIAILSKVYIRPLNTLVYTDWIPALGMGYYTLQIIGYIIDCYWENVTPQKNPVKLFLFTAYFPQLTTGPISRYAQLEDLYRPHHLSYQNLAFGCQRILWGLLKKLVLAERVGTLVGNIMSSGYFWGYYAWLIILLYPIQMYADFSGCMDIVLGASELFGIPLAENFRNPFFSRNSQEFWQRWHITLGSWAKDYVLYPLLKSKAMVNLSKKARKRFGKKTGKFLVNAIAMFALWMVMGLWHGGWRFIVGVSLWYWVILMLGELLSPYFQKLTRALHIKTDSFSWHLFQSCRTYLIYAVGALFFSAGISQAMLILRSALNVFRGFDYANPWIFFDGTLAALGLGNGDLNLVFLCVGLLILVGCLREKYGYARVWMQKQGFVFRWLVWIGLFLLVLIYGQYGPGFNAAQFIYQGF